MNIAEIRNDEEKDQEDRTEWVREDIYEFKVVIHYFNSILMTCIAFGLQAI
jgi:hypothetical protein